ncbi:PREDICTED: putative [Prunus dulcis]|uniref:PREDICTED: putative n=1 Tax=Prunus dulcis TaxID=3755 RepID=A0A5E4G4V1_PRUDU|nr:PREDICTED: putative [Prunus dulcis]
MEALPEWLGNLASLQILSIWKCKNLMYLPTLEAMKCLTKLQYIYIFEIVLFWKRDAIKTMVHNGPRFRIFQTSTVLIMGCRLQIVIIRVGR